MNRSIAIALGAALSLAGCPSDPMPTDSGSGEDAGPFDAGPVASMCGNGVVDDGEECDDMNAVAFDGCEPGSCQFTCEETAECDDLEVCSGTEACADHRCVAGTALADGTACTTESIAEGDCRGSRCISVTCGDGARDADEPCDDGNTTAGDGCEPDCTFTCEGDALDADGDGHASDDLGPCGTDCDDARADVFPGAAELCDGVDNNCNVDVDETQPTWFVDCDEDGFAANLLGNRMACEEPPASATGCASGGRWTTTRPNDPSTTDCNDANENMFPGQSMYFGTAHSSGASDTIRFGNYNCNGVVEYDHATTALSSSTCSAAFIFDRAFCNGSDGWTSGTRACGSTGTYSDCAGTMRTTLGCERAPGCITVCTNERGNCDCSPGSRDCDLECFCCARTSMSGVQMRCR